jgi:hypothetical protein
MQNDNEKPEPRADKGNQPARRPYDPPRFERLGTIAEVTEMPGGSLGAEGGSGKGRFR